MLSDTRHSPILHQEKPICTVGVRRKAPRIGASKAGSGRPTGSTSRHRDAAEYGYSVPCFHPLRAWRTQEGQVRLGRELPDSTLLRLPCGGCLGCRTARAKAWALRCQLELQQHPSAVFTTLTYDDDHLPATLEKRHVQLWLKRLRKETDRRIRFFASGEYGESNERPHYHAIVYGLQLQHRDVIERTWGAGLTHTVNVSAGAIAYVAGYTSKKIGYKLQEREAVDPSTGEVFTWQPPFIQMSRKPGIGGHARQYAESWRLYAVMNGYKMPVPRFLHEAWKNQATPEQQEDLIYEKSQLASRDTSETRLRAAEKIAIAKQSLQGDSRKL